MVKTIYLKESNCFKESVLLYFRSLLSKPFCLFWWNFDQKYSDLIPSSLHGKSSSHFCICFKSQIQALSSSRKNFFNQDAWKYITSIFPSPKYKLILAVSGRAPGKSQRFMTSRNICKGNIFHWSLETFFHERAFKLKSWSNSRPSWAWAALLVKLLKPRPGGFDRPSKI